MFEINIDGFDDLSRELREAEEALKQLHGELGEISFDPEDPKDVQRAVMEMEKLIDQRVVPYSRNVFVSEVVAAFKSTVRDEILKVKSGRHKSERKAEPLALQSEEDMTVSREVRLENLDKALRILMDELGEESIIMNFFERPAPEYGDILNTTWDDLEESGLIRTASTTMGGLITFQLTGSGWIEGLKRAGQFEAVLAKLPQLCQASKDRVKGREDDDCCHVSQLAADSNLTRSFIENVVESALLQHQFLEKKMRLDWWDTGSLRQFVRIPRSFGMERL